MIRFFPIAPAGHPLDAAVKAVREHLILCALFSAATNILILGPALYSIQVYDRVVGSRSELTLAFLTMVLVVTLLASAVLDNLRARVMNRVGARFEAKLRQLVFGEVVAAHQGNQGVRRGFRDVEVLRQVVSGPAFMAGMDAPWALLFIAICFMINVWIGVLTLIGGCVLLALAVANERALREPVQASIVNAGRVSALSDVLGQSSDIVRTFGMRNALAIRLSRMRSDASDTLLASQLRAGSYQSSIRFARMVLQSGSLGLAAWLVITNKMSPGGMFAASMLTARALAPIEMAVASWTPIVQARQSWDDLTKLLQNTADGPDKRLRLPDPKGRLEVQGVNVALSPTSVLLRNVSFTVEPGEILGIVGASGSGKTTLSRVLAGLHRAAGGSVRIDGAELHHWNPDQLAEVFGWAPQGSSLITGTIRENISRFRGELGEDPEAIDAAVVAAARAAGAHEMILGLGQGYDTPVGPGGVGLSGGQGQRIALARALFRGPRLLLLDEPDAFLDAEGEQALHASINEAKLRGAAVVLIGHRPQLMRLATRLMMIQDGQLLPASLTPKVQPVPMQRSGEAAAG